MIGVKKHKFSLMVSTPSELKQIITHMIFFKTVTWNNFCAIFGQIRKLFMKLTAEKKHFWNFWPVFPQQIWPTTQYYYTTLRKSQSLTFFLSKGFFRRIYVKHSLFWSHEKTEDSIFCRLAVFCRTLVYEYTVQCTLYSVQCTIQCSALEFPGYLRSVH